MKNKITAILLLVLLMLLVVPLPFLGGVAFAQPNRENELHPVVPYHALPDSIRAVLHEYASLPALESIRGGRPSRVDLIEAGIRRERFEGDIIAVYHEFGAVYIFRGSGKIVHVDGGMDIVEAPQGVIVVVESWCTEKLESKIGRRQPPEAPEIVPHPVPPSSHHRIYAGIDTRRHEREMRLNHFFGASAEVRFPQGVTTDFNVYTTHVVLLMGDGSRDWFESFVGQYAWEGGAANRPNAGAWYSRRHLQRVWQMAVTPGSIFKRARIQTAYETSPQSVVRMWITDLDLGVLYERHEWIVPDARTTGVTLVQEQRTLHPVATPWAEFRNTLILRSGNRAIWRYEDWTPTTGSAGVWTDPPMQMHMVVPATYDFNTRGG